MTRNQIAYWELQERTRNNMAVEAETERSNKAREAETKRSNLARESETRRSNIARERETNRTNLANETLRNLERQQQFILTTRAQEETARSNRAREQLTAQQLLETKRLNSANIMINQQKNAIAAQQQRSRETEIAQNYQLGLLRDLRSAQANAENIRSHKASESIGYGNLAENTRSNLANESVARQKVVIEANKAAEIERSNRAREMETNRHNQMTEAAEWVKVVTPLIAANSDSIKKLGFNVRFNLAKALTQ